MKITNLDEEDDDIILQEDHIYYAHVSYFIETARFSIKINRNFYTEAFLVWYFKAHRLKIKSL